LSHYSTFQQRTIKVRGIVTTLGAGQKEHLSSAEENVPSVLKLVTCAVVHGMPASISSAFGLRYPSGHPDN